MDGLAAKYEQQRQSMVAEEAGYALVIQVPEAVMMPFVLRFADILSLSSLLLMNRP